MRIGIFDSGLGGINVLKEMIKVHPDESYVYIGDNKNVPYGNKSINELYTNKILKKVTIPCVFFILFVVFYFVLSFSF